MSGRWRLLRYDWPMHFVLLFTNWLPDNVIFLRLRGTLARPFFGSCGQNLRLGRNLVFYNPSRMFLGRDIYIAYGGWFMAGDTITIGDEVQYGPYCVTVSSNHTRVKGSFRYGAPKNIPITVGSGAWIGAHATLTAGTAVGTGTIVAAGAVVGGEIPKDVLAGGVPARVIKPLADD